MPEYDWSFLEVALLSWNDDEEVESPAWEDVEEVLDELADGALDRGMALRLEDDGDGTRPPELIISSSGERLTITFASEELELWPGEDDYDARNTKRIVKLFYDEQRLDPSDGWDSA